MSPNNQKSGMLLGLEFSSVKKCNNNELKSQPREGILGGGVCSFHLVAKKKKITSSIKDPHTLKVWNSSELSVCAYLQILTLFRTKPYHSPQPFSADLACEKCTWVANPQVFRFSFEKRMTKFAWKFARMFFVVVVVVVALRHKYFSSLLWFPWKSISTQNHYGLNIDLFTNQRLNNPIPIRCLLSLTLSPGVIPSSLISSFVMICKLVREQYKDYYSCDLMRLLKVRIGENSPLHFPCLDWKLKQRKDLCATVSLQPRNPDWAVS